MMAIYAPLRGLLTGCLLQAATGRPPAADPLHLPGDGQAQSRETAALPQEAAAHGSSEPARLPVASHAGEPDGR